MVKTQRNRYIAFIVHTPVDFSRRDIISVLKNLNPRVPGLNPWLILFEGKAGIVRCPHAYKDETIKILSSINSIAGKTVKIHTVTTSGTMRGAKRALGQSIKDRKTMPDRHRKIQREIV